MFIEKKYIGGVEEIQKLHDDKKFEKLFDCRERINDIEGCEVCGDIKLEKHVMEVVKSTLKVIMKKMVIVRLMGECGFQRCSCWNENGLIRCSMCCF